MSQGVGIHLIFKKLILVWLFFFILNLIKINIFNRKDKYFYFKAYILVGFIDKLKDAKKNLFKLKYYFFKE